MNTAARQRRQAHKKRLEAIARKVAAKRVDGRGKQRVKISRAKAEMRHG